MALVGGGVGGYLIGSRHADTTTTTSTPVSLSTAKVQQLDLVTYDETTATLGFTTSATVSSPVAGTVTSVVSGGDTVDAGTVVATVDGAPVVAMIGDIPGYRDLSTSSSDGADIRQLELNLVQLGFDPDHEIVIDESYDAATKAAVTSWEDSLGLTGDGEISQGELVFIPGRLLVDTVSATVGGSVSAGSALVVGRQAERKYLVSGVAGATIDRQAAAGAKVTTGTVLFWSNGLPVIAIEGDAAATPVLSRDLSDGVDDGADVKLFEQALSTLGFTADGAMIVDDHFDSATATATAAWLASLGYAAEPASIVMPAGSFSVVPAGLSIGTALVADGTVLEGDSVVMSLTAPSRQVTTTAPIGDATFALGATIDIEFPDGTVQPGAVVEVGNVATNANGAPGDTPSVTITIGVDNIPATVDSFVEIPVTLRVVSANVPDAIVVPVSALVALKEGGYAVEVVTGANPDGSNQTKLVGVTAGLFTNGFVQVEGDLAADADVVVPS
ncbi:MAG: peptidoglycan-binding protein [Actinomycetota bacterium]|nr:peptidoglycan-binding protein [Actinomycetota bacterium]